MAIVFLVTTVICAIGWLCYWVASAALAKYMLDKGYTPPSDKEMKACSMYVWNQLLRRKR